MNLQDFKDKLSRELYEMTAKEAQEKRICIQCREPALQKCYSEAGVREFYISGLCEKCFDEITNGD